MRRSTTNPQTPALATLPAALAVALATLLGALALPPSAGAKGGAGMVAPGGVTVPGSPYRYVAIAPGFPDRLTVVEQIERRGGNVRRWWYLRGGFHVPAVAQKGGSAGGLAADGSRLVLVENPGPFDGKQPRTRLAILKPGVSLRRAPGTGRPDWVDFVNLPGEWQTVAISPDGATLYLSRYPARVEEIRPGLYRPLEAPAAFEVRALDLASGRLLPAPISDRDGERPALAGIPWAQVGDGRWSYALYVDKRRRARRDAFVYALDTVRGQGTRIDLPWLKGLRDPYSLRLRLDERAHTVTVVRRLERGKGAGDRLLATIDAGSLAARRSRATSSVRPALARELGKRLVSMILPGGQDRAAPRYGLWDEAIGRSARGREIHLIETGDRALPARLLVFGCIHGDECAGSGLRPLSNGCPDPAPDGLHRPQPRSRRARCRHAPERDGCRPQPQFRRRVAAARGAAATRILRAAALL